MKVNLICAVIASAFLFAATAFANEPHWTPQERTEQRAAVLRGTVLSVTKLKAINDREDLMSAEIRVAQVLKKADKLPEKIVTVFYATSPQGACRRCPAYAGLVPDQTATFYLSYHDELTKKKDFIIEMGSDVIQQGEPAAQPVSKGAPPFKTGIRNVEPPVGSLGYPIGSYLTIEGVREEVGKVGNQTLRVDTINGHKLDLPVPIWMNGVELPEKERCIFKGFETGQWIGVPHEVIRATGRPAPQAGWQFKFSFSPTSVEQPKNLEIK